MHAAVDAMRPMGFSPDVVRKSVRNLLKVPGTEHQKCARQEYTIQFLKNSQIESLPDECPRVTVVLSSHGKAGELCRVALKSVDYEYLSDDEDSVEMLEIGGRFLILLRSQKHYLP